MARSAFGVASVAALGIATALNGPAGGGLQVSADGQQILAVSASAPGPVVIRADGTTEPTVRLLGGLSYIVRHPTLPVFYAAKESGTRNRILVALTETANGWRELGRVTTGVGPVHIAFDASGRTLFVAGYTDGDLTRVSVDGRGVPTASKRIRLPRGHGPDAARQSGPHTHSSAVSADDRYVVVTDLGTDSLHVLDANSLALVRTERLPPGTGPRTAVFADPFSLVVSEELRGAVSWWQFNNGRLTLVRRINLGATTPSDVIVRPDSATASGPAVLVISRATDELIAISADGEGRRWATPQCGARFGAWTAADVVTLACTRGNELRGVRLGTGTSVEIVGSRNIRGVSSFAIINAPNDQIPFPGRG